ncbi:hypothetical protein J437_LFUL016199, partial [Ladona fulva]
MFHSFEWVLVQWQCECMKLVPAFWKILALIHIPFPTMLQLENLAHEIYTKWNFPNCVGEVDSKHVRIQCPPHSGTMKVVERTFKILVCKWRVAENEKETSVDHVETIIQAIYVLHSVLINEAGTDIALLLGLIGKLAITIVASRI